MTTPLLEARDLTVHFHSKHGPPVRAVQHVTLSVNQGETLGIVGESGSGKSTLGRALLQLIRPTSGQVWFQGEELTGYWRRRFGRWRWDKPLRDLRQHMQVIFQDPYASLDPRMNVCDIITEPLVIFGKPTHDARRKSAHALMERVGLDPRYAQRYPHQFSGGQRQRIGIARALALQPKLIVCDEPLSALDVSIQAQIMLLMQELQRDFGLTYIFIAHDLASVRYMSNRVAVMHLGEFVEYGSVETIYDHPQHSYTQALLKAASARNRTTTRDSSY